ncbi:hypothetical protein RCL1_005118 [Eukaryota sp. TZLM3-RCL]
MTTFTVPTWPSFPLYDRDEERRHNADTAAVRRLLATARRSAVESRKRAVASRFGSLAVDKIRRRRVLRQLVNRVSTDSRSSWKMEFSRRRRNAFLEQRVLKARRFSKLGAQMLNASTQMKMEPYKTYPQAVSWTCCYQPARTIVPLSLDVKHSKRKSRVTMAQILQKHQRAFIRRNLHLLQIRKKCLGVINKVNRSKLLRKAGAPKPQVKALPKAKRTVRFFLPA